MPGYGIMLSPTDARHMQPFMAYSPSQTAFVAPSVYRLAKSTVVSWMYYNSFQKAYDQYLIIKGKSLPKPAPTGYVNFTAAATNQTLGINVDFYTVVNSQPMAVPYAFIRQNVNAINDWLLIRFFKTDGAGPFFTIVHTANCGFAATKIADVKADKVAALDNFHRNLQQLKAHHNSLVTWLNAMSKRPLSAWEQKYFNQGMLLLQNMRQQIASIKGIQVNYSQGGTIGDFGLTAIIIGIIILAAAASYTVITVTQEAAKVAKIVDNNNAVKFQSSYQLEVAKAVQAGLITKQTGDALIKNSQQQQQAAADNNKELTKTDEGFLSQFLTAAKWGLGFMAIKTIADNFGNKKSK